MAKKTAVPEDGATAVPKTRKTRTPKGPQLSADDLAAFAEHTANALSAARKDDTVSDDDLAILFTRNQKLKAMTAGGSDVANS